MRNSVGADGVRPIGGRAPLRLGENINWDY